jgi:RNA polymerase sigma-70 factor (ECF subfamily)
MKCRALVLNEEGNILARALQSSGQDGPLNEVPDTQLMRASTLEDLYRTQGPAIWRSLLAFTADPTVADDALSEAFAQALARGDGLLDPLAWIWRVSFRIAAGELKHRGSRTELGDHEASYPFPEPPSHVFDALRKLSPNQRLAIVLHDYADRPVAEVAATLGVTRATVYVHLSQGRRRLRSLLEEEDA